MFYVFYLNKGYMLLLEPPPLGTVSDLKLCIEEATKVNVHDQILFLTGGETASPEASLQNLDAGTDTNPVFLFRRIHGPETAIDFSPSMERDGINELYQGWEIKMDQLNRSSSATPTAVNDYATLAKNGMHVADVIIKFCAKIVSEHQYLNKGWMIVTLNLDDNIAKMQKKITRASAQANRLVSMRKNGRELLKDFDNSLDLLSRITVPQTLLLSTFCSNNEVEDMTLYDWISSKDPSYSLDILQQHVFNHLEKVDDSDLVEAKIKFEEVLSFSKLGLNRDITGIDKRLATLDSMLRTLEDYIVILRDLATKMVQPQQDSSQAVVRNQRNESTKMAEKLKFFHDQALIFIQSKDQLLNIVKDRLSGYQPDKPAKPANGWVRRAYDYLHQAHKKIIIFEDKYVGLRQRLDLAKQIKDAPLIYMAAVGEVLRRESLKKEYEAWMSIHIDKCKTFISEENDTRDNFVAKLERHFLKTLFLGMSDRIPEFTVQSVPKIDASLPKVTVDHLIELRKSFSDMKELRIPPPRIFSRLGIPDMGLPHSKTLDQISSEQVNTSKFKHFPSSNWLSVDDIEMSPSVTAGSLNNGGIFNMYIDGDGENNIHQTPPTNNTCFELNSPVRFESNFRKSLSPMRPSEPIAIPQQKSKGFEQNNGSPLEEQRSYGTPDDTLTGQMDATFSDSDKFYQQLPSITRPRSLQHSFIASQNKNFYPTLGKLNLAKLFSRMSFAHDQLQHISTECQSLRSDSVNILDEISNKSANDLTSLKLIFEQSMKKMLAEKIDQANSQSEAKFADKCKILEDSYEERLKLLREELECEKSQNNSIASELDALKMLNNKLHEEKNELQTSKDILHDDFIQLQKDNYSFQSQIESMNIRQMEAEIEKASKEVGTEESSADVHEDHSTENEEAINTISPTIASSSSCAVQTRIRMKNLGSLVAINELMEGFAALLFWDSAHNAYIAYCTGQTLYFVSDESLPAVGLRRETNKGIEVSAESTASAARRGPQFALVKSMEMCRTRKPSNRYNLPVGSRFYRIHVAPLPGHENAASST